MVVNALSFAADLIGENKVSSATDLNFVSLSLVSLSSK